MIEIRLAVMNQARARPPIRQRGRIAHPGDAGHQGGEDQRGDDHLDQVEEHVGQELEIVRHLGLRRIACREPPVDRNAGDDAEHETDQDAYRQLAGHAGGPRQT